jgi:hypothetical protein
MHSYQENDHGLRGAPGMARACWTAGYPSNHCDGFGADRFFNYVNVCDTSICRAVLALGEARFSTQRLRTALGGEHENCLSWWQDPMYYVRVV